MTNNTIPQCKENHHDGPCLEIFQVIDPFEPSFIEAHKASKMTYNIWSLKSQIKTPSFLDKIITLSNEVFKDFESDLELGIRKLGNLT